MPAPIIAAATVAFLKGLSALAKKKAKSKQNKEQNRANTAKLTLAQKRSEDQRRAKLHTGVSLLNGVPSTTAGGSVNTNVGLDPSLVADLDKERTYDFGSTMPDGDKGATWEFLSGLFGDAGDVGTRAFGAPTPGGGASPMSTPSSLLTPPGGITRTPWVGSLPNTIDIETLLQEELKKNRGPRPGGTPLDDGSLY